MLQDCERGRRTEVDFISGYVSQLGAQMGVPVPMNAAIAAMVHLIEEKRLSPEPALLADLAHRAG
jgi:2-dehydropantoate 2-reductase